MAWKRIAYYGLALALLAAIGNEIVPYLASQFF
jgi:hypothetical protein